MNPAFSSGNCLKENTARIIAYRKHVKNLPTPHALQIEFHRMAVK